MLDSAAPPSAFDEYSPHGLGRGAEKVATAIPALRLFNIH
jgi:hypothetical protein